MSGAAAGWVSSFTSAATLVLGSLLVLAGALKLAHPRAFGHAVHRLLPITWDRRARLAAAAAAVVPVVELALGTALLVLPGRSAVVSAVVLAAATAVFAGFVVVVRFARRTGASCGCFGSLSDGPAGAVEGVRAMALAALAVVTLVATLLRPPAPIGARSLVVAVSIVLGLAATMTLVGRRTRSAAGPDRRAELRILAGAVISRNAAVSLPADPTPASAALVSAVRATASVTALESWLHDRGAAVPWRGATVRPVSAHRSDGRLAEGLILTTPHHEELTVTVSVTAASGMPTSDAVVFGSWAGHPVAAAGGRVIERFASLKPAAPSEAGRGAVGGIV